MFTFGLLKAKILCKTIILRNDLCNGVLSDGQVGVRVSHVVVLLSELAIYLSLRPLLKTKLSSVVTTILKLSSYAPAPWHFCWLTTHTLDLHSEFYDEHLFDDTVLEQIESIKKNSGVRITGRVKPSNNQNDSEAASTELKKFHVVALEAV